jgi:hypothetical protein
MTDAPPRRSWLGRGQATALTGAIGLLFAAGAVAPAIAQDGSADATGLSANLQAELGGEEVLHINEQFAPTSVTEPGHDEDDVVSLDIDEDFLGLSANVIASESHWGDDGASAEAEIADANLRLDDVTVLHAEVLTAEAVCPSGGDTTADAQTVGLTLLDEAIDAEADLPADVTLPVDVDVEDVVAANATVTVHQIEEAGDDHAHAAALVAHVEVEATLTDQEVVHLDVGEIVLAEANCERVAGAGDDNGAPSDDNGTTDDDENGVPDDDDGILPDDGNGLPDDDDNGLTDDDADEGPSADGLDPDSGPADGGTEVTVDGNDLDATETVTIDGDEVDFTVGDDTDTLTFTTPGGEPGTVDVEVIFDDGTSDVLEFTYEDEVLAEGMTAPEGDADANDAADADAGDDIAAAGAGDSGALPETGATSLIATARGLLLLTGGTMLLLFRGRPEPSS